MVVDQELGGVLVTSRETWTKAADSTTGMPGFPREGRAHGNIRDVLPITGVSCDSIVLEQLSHPSAF